MQKLSQRWGRSPQTPVWLRSHTPNVITPTYYGKSVEFISSVKCIVLPSKKNKRTAVNVLLLLLPQLSHLFFISNSVVFVDRVARIFLAQGRRVP